MQPELSVIIPIYSFPQFLKQCFESVRAQTFTNFEVICIDDGSKDGCGELAEEYAKLDNRFKVFHKPNGGVSSARNMGISLAQAPFTVFIDNDDIFHPKAFEIALHYAKNLDVDFIWFNFTMFSDNPTITPDFDLLPANQIKVVKNPLYLYAFKGGIWTRPKDRLPGVIWNRIYKTEFIKNFSFEEGVTPGEDNIFSLNITASAQKIAHIPYSLYFYRGNPDSVLHTFNREKFLINIKKELNSYIKLQNRYLASNISKTNKNLIKKYVAEFFFKSIVRDTFENPEKSTANELKYINDILQSNNLHLNKMNLRYRLKLFYYLNIKSLFIKKNK